MANKLIGAVVDVGAQYLQTENGRKAFKGVVGLAGIGAGSAIETAGSLVGGSTIGSAISGAGSALTGLSCAATQTGITVTGGIPIIGGAVAGVMGKMACVAFAAGPYIAFAGAAVGVGYGVYRLGKWITEC